MFVPPASVLVEKPNDATLQARRLGLTFPNRQHPPTELAQALLIAFITRPIAPNLRNPVRPIGLRHPAPARTVVTVPKAPVHENDLPARGEYEIRLSGKIRSMKPVAITEAVAKSSDYEFRLSVLSFYCGHRLAADSRVFHSLTLDG